MKIFCRLFGHTWMPETRSPSTRWNTTKDGHVLEATSADAEVQHLEVCVRFGDERPTPGRKHDREHRTADDAAADAS